MKPISENNFSFGAGFCLAAPIFYMLMAKGVLVLCECCAPPTLF